MLMSMSMNAKKYLNEPSKEYYLTSNGQKTIYLSEPNNPNMLNANGIKIYNEIQDKIKNNQYNETITNYAIMPSPSGMWINDANSDYYDPRQPTAVLNTFNNVVIYGVKKGTHEVILTSIIQMYSSEWCYTLSGSLYKLENDIFANQNKKKIEN